MKRFSAREFALLCVPVVAVAAAGFWASRRPKPQPYTQPQLALSYQAPTVLEAFDGYKAVLITDLSKDSAGVDYGIQLPNFWIDVTTPQSTKTWRSDGKGSLRSSDNYAIAVHNNNHFSVAMKEIPPGELNFGMSGMATAQFTTGAHPAFPTKKVWAIERAKLKTFDFSLPRAPNLKIKSATISEASNRKLRVDIAFVFLGSKDLANMAWQEHYDETSGWFFVPSSGAKLGTVRNRIASVLIAPPVGGFHSGFGYGAKPKTPTVKITGRVSADNRWPLAFKTEPFEFRKVKIGQQLKFKSWPAPLPPGVKN